MNKVYEERSENLEALPVEELFGNMKKYENLGDLLIDLCIEYGRKLALEDYIEAKNEPHYLDVDTVKAILGMENEDE